MSLKAKIEAVIYAAEEPVTLAQLAAVFAEEFPPAPDLGGAPEGERPIRDAVLDTLVIGEGLLEAASLSPGDPDHMAEMALLAENERRKRVVSGAEAAASEGEAKRAARQRERDLRERVKAVVDELIQEYAAGDRGMEIREVAGGYRIATKPECHDAVRSFVKSLKPPMKLSLQALETLAVIAYKQPVTAPEVAEIRGVDSGGVLGGLIGRKLVTTAGRKQVIGRPILYKTTREFLLRFGLKDLNELPSIEEFEKLAGEIEIGEEPAESAGEAASPPPSLPFDEESGGGAASAEAGGGGADGSAEGSATPTLADGCAVVEGGAPASDSVPASGSVLPSDSAPASDSVSASDLGPDVSCEGPGVEENAGEVSEPVEERHG